MDKIVEKEVGRPKFLAHVIFPEHQYKREEQDHLKAQRYDKQIYDKLQAGETIEYQPASFSDEFAFSLHAGGRVGAACGWGYRKKVLKDY